ncbi:MAG TPA: NAD-dependent deacetylase [Gammaproteobacteria bacterium]|jgi:NAD-dependent deacetylase|nr:NAD-dependent deacetylase [Gammaproteobacteria bacterium]HIG49742.1 NAD-dependent deacetylase [Gammaproteobacteria bacterium]
MNQELSQYISEAKNIVIFTGAGISTESGIPDFRGPQGVWKTNTPIYFQDFIGSEEVRKDSWKRKFSGQDIIKKAKPNIGHLAVAEIINKHESAYLITQNVDNLHQDAGVPDDKITEIHGNAHYATCLDCGIRYELNSIKKAFLENETVPYCDSCGGIIKTATISFGQSMPEEGMQIAQRKTLGCDLFITIGTSLVVYPAAGFPKLAKEIGAKLIIINNEPTDFDPIADLVIHEQIGKVFSEK